MIHSPRSRFLTGPFAQLPGHRTMLHRIVAVGFLTLPLAVLTAGCGALDNGNDDDDTSPTPVGDSPTPGATNSIYDINQGSVADGDVVTVRGIVTGITYKDNFWISTPEGGEYSGIYVFDEYEKKGSTAGIAPGDEVEVLGVYKLFYGVRELVIYADDGAVTVVTKDKGMPTPVKLTDLSVFSLPNLCDADIDPDLEPYMGTYMELPDTTVTSADGACGSVATYGLFEISDSSGNAVLADDDTDLPYVPVLDDVIQVNGVLFYTDFDSIGNYKIMPTAIDVIDGEEQTPTPTPDPDLTIQELNQNPVAPNTLVTVSGIVTVIDANANFWIQDEEGGLWSGMYIYDEVNKKGTAAGIAPGDLVEVTGAFKVFYDLREIQPYEEADKGVVKILTKGKGLPTPIDYADLGLFSIANVCKTAVDTEAEPYVGVLMKISGAEVSSTYANGCSTDAALKLWNVADASGDEQVVYSKNVTQSYVPKEGDTVDITGVIYYSFEQYKIVPMNETGVVKK